jgi:hypothetical protein
MLPALKQCDALSTDECYWTHACAGPRLRSHKRLDDVVVQAAVSVPAPRPALRRG